DADHGSRARRRNGLRCRMAHRILAAAAAACRDQPVQARCRLPVVFVDRQRQRRAQSSRRQRGDQRGSAVESRQALATHRPRLAGDGRKTQMRSVSVINLVTEGSIEHNILHLLGRKQALADGVIDGAGDLASLKMPSGRAAFIERMQAMMAVSLRPVVRVLPPEEVLVADLVERHGDNVLLVEARHGIDGRPKLLVVLDLDPPTLAAETARLSAADSVAVDVVDRATWVAMQRFAASGLLQFTHESRLLHRSAMLAEQHADAPAPDQRSGQLMAEAQRALRMAKVLASGGFPEEVPALLAKVLQKAGAAWMADRTELPAGASTASDTDIRRLVQRGEFPADALAI